MGAVAGAALAVAAYLFFSWGMASGFLPVPSKRAQRRIAIAALSIALAMLAAQLVLVVWAHLER